MKLSCWNCEELQEVELVKDYDIIFVDGKPRRYYTEYYKCLVCGEEFLTAKQMDNNLSSARKAKEGKNDSDWRPE